MTTPPALSRVARRAGRVATAALVLSAAFASHVHAQETGAPPPSEAPATPATDAAAPLKPLPTTAAPEAAPAPQSSGDERYELKLRELEEKVVNLKEKIFRTKTRLLLLKERVLNDVIAEAKAEIVHVNEMGSSFRPEQVFYELDGERIYFADSKSGALETEEFEIFSGNVLAGNHVLAVEMIYRGDSTMFSYLNDYVFKLRASYTFYATKGKVTTVRTIGYKKGDFTYDLTKRPSIKFDVKQVSYTKDQEAGSTSGGGE